MATAINVSATIAQTLTPTGPSEIKVCATGLGGPPQTVNLESPSDGKSWYFVKGRNANSGSAILATISGNTATIPQLTSSIACIGTGVETVVLHFVRA